MQVTGAQQARKADTFRKMHDRSGVLLLPNAWDAVGARLAERAGFRAVATTSGGVAWTLGYADGEAAPRDEVIALTARIARAVSCPVTADLEAGYGASAAEVAETIRMAIEAGVVGVNLEDSTHAPHGLRPAAEAAGRIEAAREAAMSAGVPIVINARVDTYATGYGASEVERFDETVRRAKAYLAAGADCVFPIGLGDSGTLGALVKALDCPVNVAARPGIPPMSELAKLGVARVSTATRLASVAFGAMNDAMREIRETGSFDCLGRGLDRGDLQGLFAAG